MIMSSIIHSSVFRVTGQKINPTKVSVILSSMRIGKSVRKSKSRMSLRNRRIDIKKR